MRIEGLRDFPRDITVHERDGGEHLALLDRLL
jgi:hypothetical protein